jgi:hypothetical protein
MLSPGWGVALTVDGSVGGCPKAAFIGLDGTAL